MPFPLLIGAAALFVIALKSRDGAKVEMTLTRLGEVNASPPLFARALFNISGKVFPDLSTAGRILLTAHAAHECGWGSIANKRGETNNIFNLTKGSTWGGPIAIGYDRDSAGNLISQMWRSYASLEEAVDDYWGFLSRLYPEALLELSHEARPAQFAHALVAYRLKYYAANEAAYALDLSVAAAKVSSFIGVTA